MMKSIFFFLTFINVSFLHAVWFSDEVYLEYVQTFLEQETINEYVQFRALCKMITERLEFIEEAFMRKKDEYNNIVIKKLNESDFSSNIVFPFLMSHSNKHLLSRFIKWRNDTIDCLVARKEGDSISLKRGQYSRRRWQEGFREEYLEEEKSLLLCLQSELYAQAHCGWIMREKILNGIVSAYDRSTIFY